MFFYLENNYTMRKKMLIFLLAVLVAFYCAAAVIGHSLYWANWPGMMQRPVFAFLLGAGISAGAAGLLFLPKKDHDEFD
jgi:hypothetical protein